MKQSKANNYHLKNNSLAVSAVHSPATTLTVPRCIVESHSFSSNESKIQLSLNRSRSFTASFHFPSPPPPSPGTFLAENEVPLPARSPNTIPIPPPPPPLPTPSPSNPNSSRLTDKAGFTSKVRTSKDAPSQVRTSGDTPNLPTQQRCSYVQEVHSETILHPDERQPTSNAANTATLKSRSSVYSVRRKTQPSLEQNPPEALDTLRNAPKQLHEESKFQSPLYSLGNPGHGPLPTSYPYPVPNPMLQHGGAYADSPYNVVPVNPAYIMPSQTPVIQAPTPVAQPPTIINHQPQIQTVQNQQAPVVCL